MNIHGLYEQRQSFFLTPSSTAKGGLIFCILVGVLTFVAGMYVGEATRTWGSFLFNLFFFFSIALGGVAFSGMQDVIGASWGRPVMRLHESFATFLPISAVLLAVFFACIHFKIGGAENVYVWIREPDRLEHFWGKRDWLKPGLMIGRDLFAMALILVLAFWQLRHKLGGDLALVRGDKAKAEQLGEASRAKLRYWSAPVLILYALTFSLLSFDLLMSLAPTWYSTLWGGWSFAIMMQTLMSSLLIFMFLMKRGPIGQVIKRQQFHDVGKLMHGFTIFFAYLTFAHILTYWYGNMPEETEYYIHRLHGPWLGFVVTIPFLVFVFPLFTLLPKVSKWTPVITIPVCFSILFAQWMMGLLVVIPEVADGAKWTLPWVEIGTFFGFLGMFIAAIFWFGRRFPMVSIADPLLHEAMAEEAH